MENNNYCVYIHINKTNRKVYIGITCQKPEYRWGAKGQGYKDSPKFYNAIKKYGWDNFEHIILKENLSQQEASQLEQVFIKQYNSTNDNFGYNMTTGGETHYRFTDEVKEKLREQKLGSNNPQWGVKKTEEEKENLRKIGIKASKEGRNHAKPVKCVETGKIYFSCKEAARQTGTGNESQCTHIADVCNKKRNKCNGYTWEWESEYNEINK